MRLMDTYKSIIEQLLIVFQRFRNYMRLAIDQVESGVIIISLTSHAITKINQIDAIHIIWGASQQMLKTCRTTVWV